MSLLVARAFLRLLHFDFYLTRGRFSALHEKVRDFPRAEQSFSPDVIQNICAAVDMACIWYWKEVLCLQRSAATACLLKAHGVPAEMVIGARQLPFRAHAWVEVNGLVVNDKSYVREMYAVLDQC
jgi:Transglutaminase-like superfamily